jgi:uncharacterized protein (TIGR02246 family)
MSSTDIEFESKAILDNWAAAVRARDIDQLMALYAPDIVYFDIVPPLRIVGADAVRQNFQRWFDAWKSGIESEVRHLAAFGSGDAAVAHHLHRTSGTLKNGREVAFWLRVTNGLQRSDGKWLIVHEHVSVPVEFESSKAVMDLKP